MKKSLIALAVLGASGFAMAQSSVTLYGVADGGIGKAPGGKTGFVSSNSYTNNGASRVGLKGVEDLGGGLKAGFNFETGLWMGTGNAYGVRTGKDLTGNDKLVNQFWNRNAMVFLGGSWGQFTMGRYYTPSFSAQTGFWELTGAANYSVVLNTYLIGGDSVWQDNQFRYDAPNFGGLSGSIAYTTKNDNADLATGVTPGSKWAGAVTYANGPLSGALTVNKVQGLKTGWNLGGRYNMGNFIVAASYNDARSVRRGISIGGTAIFGAASATLDITRDTKNAAGKRTNFVLEGKYSLSKRTFAYADYLRVDRRNSYTIGVRHNF
ncbi:MAG: hypothetical protein BGO13_04205 [Burkholderiales bacterium 66-5]|uniref:porin n=1 Tax=Comamonas sp. SCN 65-56 TaxID=1660095 RepID=UPI00086A91F6|nr:porin [Comamonas sp. SCN 65-56]ODS93300.1 MAG: hypothetical protein ABS45_03680 [Comamonas sp. SCN 65-56]OJU89497.1 MAG: hypothetical protein BGO13_04205 [Burkholderiales bacterium 66-5]